MIKKYFVSAYATSPSFYEWQELLETNYFKQLADNSKIIGIEHPYFLNSNKYPIDWLVNNIPKHWKLIVTSLPQLMQLAQQGSNIGLASINEKERSFAVSLIEKIRSYAEDLEKAFGRNIIDSINLYSSPKNNDQLQLGSKKSLQQSLREVVKMNWGEIALNLEHCDAYVPHKGSDKGFLSLEDEISVIQEVKNIGIILNWGRSAIELASSKGPLDHIKKTQSYHLLKGFVFSGCTDCYDSPYGAWKDTHIPPKNFIQGSYLKNESLLGEKEIHQIFDLLNNQHLYFGIKVLDPSPSKEIERSLGLNLETIECLEKTWKKYHSL